MSGTSRLLVTLAVTLLLAGCSTSSSNPLGIFPEGQQLLRATKEARKINSEPWDIPRELAKATAPSYVIEPGDVLLVQTADFDSNVRIPADQPVLPDGTINLGKYGRLHVAGMTIDEVELAVINLVRAKIEKPGDIYVRIISRQSKVYYVLGEVNAPGAYPLQGRETVLDAILAAGGVNTRADLKKITMSRPTPPNSCRVVLPICYEQIVQLGDTSTNYQIAAGDRIFVPSKCFLSELKNHSGKQCPTCDRPQYPCTSPDGCQNGGCSSWHSVKPGPVPEAAYGLALPRNR